MRRAWPTLQKFESGVIRRNHAGTCTGFDGHIADRHALVHVHRTNGIATVFDDVASASIHADLADDGQDHVFGGNAARQMAANVQLQSLGFTLQQALGCHHVANFRSAYTEGEGAKCTVRAGVAVSAHDGLAGLCCSQFRPDHVHDSAML